MEKEKNTNGGFLRGTITLEQGYFVGMRQDTVAGRLDESMFLPQYWQEFLSPYIQECKEQCHDFLARLRILWNREYSDEAIIQKMSEGMARFCHAVHIRFDEEPDGKYKLPLVTVSIPYYEPPMAPATAFAYPYRVNGEQEYVVGMPAETILQMALIPQDVSIYSSLDSLEYGFEGGPAAVQIATPKELIDIAGYEEANHVMQLQENPTLDIRGRKFGSRIEELATDIEFYTLGKKLSMRDNILKHLASYC